MASLLVGTSFSDAGPQDFGGFLHEQYIGLPVSNFGITGGNQFGSIASYVTSRDFADNRPRYLIWENPVYNSLAGFGDAPMLELIAAAKNDCTPVDSKAITAAADGSLDVELGGLEFWTGFRASLLADVQAATTTAAA